MGLKKNLTVDFFLKWLTGVDRLGWCGVFFFACVCVLKLPDQVLCGHMLRISPCFKGLPSG